MHYSPRTFTLRERYEGTILPYTLGCFDYSALRHGKETLTYLCRLREGPYEVPTQTHTYQGAVKYSAVASRGHEEPQSCLDF